ncbi:MAG: hypothetical protein ACRCSB_03120 [Bacteroidales bacterium]
MKHGSQFLWLIFIGFCLLKQLNLNAQEKLTTSEVITTNFDSLERKIYAVMRYAPAGADTCLQAVVDTILFRLQKKVSGIYEPVGNNGGYDAIHLIMFQSDSIGALIDPTYTKKGETFPALVVFTEEGLPGYNLVFDLKNEGLNIREEDSIMITLETKLPAIRCRWCGVGHSDIMINPFTDIDSLCPYPKKDKDLLWCQKRKGGAKNWEGYIRDPRDCRIYRIVRMPENPNRTNPEEGTHRWWFARNLNYMKGLRSTVFFLPAQRPYTASGTGDAASTDISLGGYMFCPQNDGATSSATTSQGNSEGYSTSSRGSNLAEQVANHPGGPWNCEVYGALYPYGTWSRLDGNGAQTIPPRVTATIPATTQRGICPIGWSIPSSQHWGAMLNAVDGCTTPTVAKTGDFLIDDTCGHFRSDYSIIQNAVLSYFLSSVATPGPIAYQPNNQPTAMNSLSTNAGNSIGTFFARVGKNAGKRLKAVATCPPGTYNCDNWANDETIYGIWTNGIALGKAGARRTIYTRWMYAERENSGNDYYGFSIIPSGMNMVTGTTNTTEGSVARGRGQWAIFAVNTLGGSTQGVNLTPNYRMFEYDKSVATKIYQAGSGDPKAANAAISVRCIKL